MPRNYQEMMVIVRPEKAMIAESTLMEGGAEYVMRQSVTGRGKEMGIKFIRAWLGWRRKAFPYLRKTLLVALVPKNEVNTLTRQLIKKTTTGQHGDGKIFIMPTQNGGPS